MILLDTVPYVHVYTCYYMVSRTYRYIFKLGNESAPAAPTVSALQGESNPELRIGLYAWSCAEPPYKQICNSQVNQTHFQRCFCLYLKAVRLKHALPDTSDGYSFIPL